MGRVKSEIIISLYTFNFIKTVKFINVLSESKIMNFKFKCKVCGQELPEGENLLKHIAKHPPILYFDTMPEVSWSGKKVAPKPAPAPEPEEEAIEEEVIDEDEFSD